MSNHNLSITLRRRRGLLFSGGALLVIIAVLIVGGLRLSIPTRMWVIKALQERFDSDIEMDNFNVSLFPHVQITGGGLVFRHKGRTDVPPLIAIKQFSADARLFGLLRHPKRAQRVRLEGLQIHVPPRRDQSGDDRPVKNEAQRSAYSFIIDEIIADGTRLLILPKETGKEPLIFEIDRLTLHSVGTDRPLVFRASIANPQPPGQIHSTGEFGPWQASKPRWTPVSGRYTFQNADLSTYRGLAGRLSSEGTYKGVLERIEVDGTTDTPDFTLTTSGHPVHLKTQFHAIVDGTSGDTLLQPVNAQFLRSAIVARGRVVETSGRKGKTVALDVVVTQARIEDLLRLAIKSNRPPLTGTVRFKTQLGIPPGDQDVADKLYLNGAFGIESARFTNLDVQNKIETLSRRSRGQPTDDDSGRVASNLKGRFVLKNGVTTFSNLSFDVPGASVLLSGNYTLRSEELDFRGTLRMQAKLSQTTTGFKSFLLKAVDPLFKRDGAGAVLPIRITGTREETAFKLDVGRALKLKSGD